MFMFGSRDAWEPLWYSPREMALAVHHLVSNLPLQLNSVQRAVYSDAVDDQLSCPLHSVVAVVAVECLLWKPWLIRMFWKWPMPPIKRNRLEQRSLTIWFVVDDFSVWQQSLIWWPVKNPTERCHLMIWDEERGGRRSQKEKMKELHSDGPQHDRWSSAMIISRRSTNRFSTKRKTRKKEKKKKKKRKEKKRGRKKMRININVNKNIFIYNSCVENCCWLESFRLDPSILISSWWRIYQFKVRSRSLVR